MASPTDDDAAAAAAAACQVRVAVRVRPLTSQEAGQGGSAVLTAVHPEICLGQRRFTYDAVFDSTVGQTELYQSVSAPLLTTFVDGYNATIMAYGQTGSGKTFTMGSEAHSELELSHQTGLIPRFMNQLFEHLQRKKQASDDATAATATAADDSTCSNSSSSLVEYNLQASFLEVYGEDIHDLLDHTNNTSRPSLPLREDAAGGICITGLTSRTVKDGAQALKVLHEGTLNRTTAATLMNLTSSRSHAVFTVTLQQVHLATGGNSSSVPVTTSSRFTFVDLAGSERMKKTGAEGERAREGIKINEGLLALGNVINALADEERVSKDHRKVHVPYRQSKLTRLLQDALGGNSQTLFLACVSPSDTNASETLSTLHYANRARNIKNAPTKNVDGKVLELQRLYAWTHVLQAELVKQKFGENLAATVKVGVADKALMQRPEVAEYLQELQAAAREQQDSSPGQMLAPLPALTNGTSTNSFETASWIASPNGKHALHQQQVAVTSTTATASSTAASFQDPNKSILDNFDTALLGDVNPDEDMAILDQLLELQHQDQEFGKEQKNDDDQLKKVEGELAEQEGLLLQLRDSLKIYHDMKAKYEVLMAEVQQLEVEKAQLAEQLEKSTVDPTQGCSTAIKKELEKVEQSLARARNETRKHRQMYRKAEQEAQRCRVLERKVSDLKIGRTQLMKKQKEAAARHREYTETKTREIMSLKRKERNAEKQVSKLQTEIQRHKKQLQNRHTYCNKLTDKLKQTESHLMKLLSMRQRDLHDRSSSIGISRRGSTTVLPPRGRDDVAFAASSEEIKSINFILEKAVAERVNSAEVKRRYEERVAEYSETMRKLVFNVKSLEEARTKARVDTSDEVQEDIRELEQTIEDIELRAELVGSELEELGEQLSHAEERSYDETSDPVTLVIESKTAPVLRTLLMETIDKYTSSELDRKQLANAIERKESALQSFETEVDSLNNRIAALTEDINRRRAMVNDGEDPVEVIGRLDAEKSALSTQLEEWKAHLTTSKSQLEDFLQEHRALQLELSETKEQLSLTEVTLKQTDGVSVPQDVLDRLQIIWKELGVSPDSRNDARKQIDCCLEDTCARNLKEASTLKGTTEVDIQKLRTELGTMRSCLGIQPEVYDEAYHRPLLEELATLRHQHERLEPIYISALARKEKIVKQVSDLSSAMGLSKEDLTKDLQTLLFNGAGDSMSTNCSLSNDFLSRCDEYVSSLRIQKSQALAQNAERMKATFSVAIEMNLAESDVLPLVSHSLRQRLNGLPAWWNKDSAETVTRAVTVAGGVVRATDAFNQHLSVVHESLLSVAKSRRQLSDTLRDIVERAQKTLLETVDSEVDAIEACSSFHDALFKLPSLSKERVHACMSEIEALVTGVDAMTQSEIEALTVVWEALSISMSDRGRFWSGIEDAMTSMQTQPGGPFDDVLDLCRVDGEEWVLAAVKGATKNYRLLESRLYKLERTHQEVERLRTRQDSKSQIISLDSEVRILSAKLSEFEDKKCNKQRLLTKKSGSVNLLKEERFRKQMQSKFSSKLEQLATLLKAWSHDEISDFDPNLLSDEVRTLLQNSDKDNWVEKRTEFMHLRTTQITTTAKRGPESISRDNSATPPQKRQARPPRQSRTNEATAPKIQDTKQPSRSIAVSTTREKVTKKRKPEEQQQGPAKSARIPRSTRAAPKSPASPARKSTRATREIPRSPLSSAPNKQPTRSKPASSKKRLTLPPFGHVLEQALTPRKSSKENTTGSE